MQRGDANYRRQERGRPNVSRRRKRYAEEKRMVVTFVFIAIALFAIIISSGGIDGDNSYSIITPSVYQGESLEISDFISVRSALAEINAEFADKADTSSVGNHSVTVVVTGSGDYERVVNCKYTVKPIFRDGAVLEAGFDSVDVADMIDPEIPRKTLDALSPRITGELPANNRVGDAVVTAEAGGITMTVNVRVVDTTPPVATPKTVAVSAGAMPSAADFVDVTDVTEVQCAFAADYKFTTVGMMDVDIIVTDEGGNTARVTASAECLADDEPPVLTWDDDLYMELGGTVSYKKGVTATDNSGGDVTYTVNANSVDRDTLGDYTVIYTATDAYGNSADFERVIHVVEQLPVSEEILRAIAEDIYKNYINTSENMTKWDISYAIFRWTHDTIQYVGTGIDKSNWMQAAYDGFATHSGDCFTYMSAARALFDAAGIPCQVVEHINADDPEAFHHWWLLVDIGTGWYHFDSTRRKLCPEFEAFMRTDAELLWYGENYDEKYYVFDESAYPQRETESFYAEVLQPPAEIDPGVTNPAVAAPAGAGRGEN